MIPYAKPAYREEGDSITRLLMEQGRIQADRAQQSGAIWGNAVQGLGQTVAGAVQEHGQAAKMARRDAAWVAYVKSGEWSKDPRAAYTAALRVWGPQEGPRQFEALQAVGQIGQGKPEEKLKRLGIIIGAADKMKGPARAALWQELRTLGQQALPEVAIPEQYDEAFWSNVASPLGAQIRGEKQGEGFTLSAGQTRFGADGQQVASVAPEPPKPAQPRVVGRSLVDDSGKVIYRDPAEPKADNEPLMAVIGDDGQPVYLPRSQAVGKRPASSREQGRPVTSGDAGRVADLDTSMDDLNVLERDLGKTGTGSKVGAMLPNAVTDLTGWGADSKARQAVIDRVKQVIGKALEGGVLRKEDEYKYEKILPTIGDTETVAKSKINGLRSALKQRKQTFIESLSDAGYDTSRYEARKPRAPKAPAVDPEDDALLKKYGY